MLVAVISASPALAAPHIAAADTDSPIAAHSMLYVDSPYAFKAAMFAEAVQLHASAIRVDIAPAVIFQQADTPPDFTGVDEYMSLSARYHIRVLANLATIPLWLANCKVPPAQMPALGQCATDNATQYAADLAAIAVHTRGVIDDFEIWNEPDLTLNGTPTQYARMLTAAYDAIHRVDPRASVLLGGISNLTGTTWLRQVFATPGPNAARHFDIANVHLRGRLTAMGPDVRRWRAFFARDGFGGPLWITEHGYPADPAYQWDPAYRHGPMSQARYLVRSVQDIVDAGAQKVFITERDLPIPGPFATEGLLSGVSDPNSTVIQPLQRPAFASLAALSASLARPTTARPPRDNARPSRVGERRAARSDAVLCPPSNISGLFGDLGG